MVWCERSSPLTWRESELWQEESKSWHRCCPPAPVVAEEAPPADWRSWWRRWRPWRRRGPSSSPSWRAPTPTWRRCSCRLPAMELSMNLWSVHKVLARLLDPCNSRYFTWSSTQSISTIWNYSKWHFVSAKCKNPSHYQIEVIRLSHNKILCGSLLGWIDESNAFNLYFIKEG